MKEIKVGQVYKLRRLRIDNDDNKPYEAIKETYDPYTEICPTSFYIVKDLFYLDKNHKHWNSHMLMVDIETEYSEIVDEYRIYGDFDEKKILRKLKLKNIIDDDESKRH